MQNNTAFSKITVDTGARNRERFNLSHNVFTSASFGDVQPLQCKLLVPNTKATCSVSSLVRMSAMVSPTYGDMKFKVWHHFVGMSDLLRSFSKFLVGEPYGSASGVRVQQYVPRMRLCDLSAAALIGSRLTFYAFKPTADNPTPNYDAVSRQNTWLLDSPTGPYAAGLAATLVSSNFLANVGYQDARFPGYNGTFIAPRLFAPALPTNLVPTGVIYNSSTGIIENGFGEVKDSVGKVVWEPVPLESADMVFIVQVDNLPYAYPITQSDPNPPTFSTGYIAIAVRLSAFGKRIRKALIGCGYQLNFKETTSVSVLPLMAYYKAYFDTFGLCLYDNYESSNADVLLKQYDAGTNNFDFGNVNFCRFLYDLGNAFVTDEQDFISAHQRTDAVSTGSTGFVNNIVLDPNYNGQVPASNIGQDANTDNEYNGVKPTTNHVFIDKVNHSEVSAELLKILYKWTNRNTVAGRRIAELLRAAGYGKYVDEQKSNFIGYSSVQIDVSDVNATADAFNSESNTGSMLGEYAGKGVGFDERQGRKNFTYENNEFGFWVTLAALVPNSGYCQGVDPCVYDVERYDYYTGDYDGVGMEYSRKSLLVGSTDWESSFVAGSQPTAESFGLVPRYSRYKVAQNKCNGDFSLRGVRDGYLPYMLDKFIEVGNQAVDFVGTDSQTGVNVYRSLRGLEVGDLPLAGNAWRYNSRYPWLNNFDRIFAAYYSDKMAQLRAETVVSLLPYYEFTYNEYDGFIVLNGIDLTIWSPMLPIADSYGTTDENDGKGDTSFGKA